MKALLCPSVTRLKSYSEGNAGWGRGAVRDFGD